MKERPDEAWETVLKLHAGGKTTGANQNFASEEFYQMKRQVIADNRSSAGETVWTLFTKPSYRKRMICVFLVMFGAESTGILVIYSTFTPENDYENQTETNPRYRLQRAPVSGLRLQWECTIIPCSRLRCLCLLWQLRQRLTHRSCGKS